jgi:cell division protein FtsB
MQPRQPQIGKIVVWIISLILCLSAGGTIVNLWARRGIVSEREADLARLQQENKTLENALQDARGEQFVERVARDKLGMVKPGETIVIMPDSAGNEINAAHNNSNTAYWRQWWGIFFDIE